MNTNTQEVNQEGTNNDSFKEVLSIAILLLILLLGASLLSSFGGYFLPREYVIKDQAGLMIDDQDRFFITIGDCNNFDYITLEEDRTDGIVVIVNRQLASQELTIFFNDPVETIYIFRIPQGRTLRLECK